jgi:serine/threonine protein kinase
MRDPSVGDRLDQYQLTELLAQGGMASVFKAVDLESGEPVVLKIPYLQYESDVVFHERFLREEQIGQKIHHPAIVRVLVPREKSRLYLAMEYVPGHPLSQVMAAERPLAQERALSIAAQLCDALSCLQEHGVVHRDVKPGNVQVLPSGEVKLLDFGIALIESARRLTWAGLSHAVGTPDYMAPEQIRGRRGDVRTDVYALGTLLYEMLTGHLPHESDSTTAVLRSKLHGEPTPPSTYLPGLDRGLEAVILRAIARDPRARYAGAAEMVQHLHSPALALSAASPVSAPRVGQRRLGRAVAAAVVVGAVLTGLASLLLLS